MNLVLSVGDLSRTSGYRTRVIEELRHLDGATGLKPVLLVLDRNPRDLLGVDGIPFRAMARTDWPGFLSEIAAIEREHGPIRQIHAHNLYSAALALTVRRRLGARVLLDYHGRIPEEYVYLGKGGTLSRLALEQLERLCAEHADGVLAVSEKLKTYLVQRYPVPASKVAVVPCCADPKLFRFDPDLRRRQREALGLDGKFVCIHLGSFFEWYDPDLLLREFARVREQTEAHLLVVTADPDPVQHFLDQHLPPELFTVTSARHDEVPAVLNAGDLGFLLLGTSPNIATSSPTKFAEYICCGLPVAITPGVGDYSEYVATHGLGFVTSSAAVRLPDSDARTRCLNFAPQLAWPQMIARLRNL